MIHPFPQLFAFCLIHAFIGSLADSSLHCFVSWFSFSLTHSLLHWSIGSFAPFSRHPLFSLSSFSPAFIHSLVLLAGSSILQFHCISFHFMSCHLHCHFHVNFNSCLLPLRFLSFSVQRVSLFQVFMFMFILHSLRRSASDSLSHAHILFSYHFSGAPAITCCVELEITFTTSAFACFCIAQTLL